MGGRGSAGQVAATKLTTVSNASPLIALNQLGLLDALAPLFAHLIIPPAVAREIAPSVTRPPWIAQRSLARPVAPRLVQAGLGPGETEAISLALELGTYAIALDERSARRLAASLGLPIVGTIGLLLAAKDHGLIPALRPAVEVLVGLGFYVAPRVIAEALADAGEGT